MSNQFVTLGATVVDTDVGARAVVEPGTTGLAEIVATFGTDMLTPSGHLDRARLRARVFSNPGLRQRLEAILHPLIADWARERILDATGPYVVVVIPLLAESSVLRPLLSRILVVDTPEDLQIHRLMARDGASREDAQAILSAQASRTARLAIADDVIENSGSREALADQVEAMHQRYLSLAANVGDNAEHRG